MNKRLEIEKRKLEIIKVKAARSEMEYKILEREEDIKRIQQNIQIQDSRVNEIEMQIAELNKLGEE